ncbi:hypothetical protein [Acerihabitans arboris]|uniref:Uncharacterized protein n=1 Tax=Acerihabitans arboris TaxID=2691583 RepID=A0A845SGZ5_9GAMM|nr:hypothetical protein [Acerihabitans arboris]NDL62316.1 hypothetical protein [Acerihabitans arboris]
MKAVNRQSMHYKNKTILDWTAFFYGILALLFTISSVVFAIPLFHDHDETGLVPRFSTAILSTGLMILSAIWFIPAILLENVTLGHREMKMPAYLSIKKE